MFVVVGGGGNFKYYNVLPRGRGGSKIPRKIDHVTNGHPLTSVTENRNVRDVFQYLGEVFNKFDTGKILSKFISLFKTDSSTFLLVFSIDSF